MLRRRKHDHLSDARWLCVFKFLVNAGKAPVIGCISTRAVLSDLRASLKMQFSERKTNAL